MAVSSSAIWVSISAPCNAWFGLPWRDVACARAAAGAEGVFHEAAQVSVPRSVEDPERSYEVNVTGTLGRYIFLPIEARHIYWQLLGLAAITLTVYWLIGRSRIGLALRVIGDDQLVASHSGIDIVKVKVALFALSAAIITLVGAVQAPRWVYVEPSIVFNPTTSFLVLIMALLGGPNRLWGAACGAIPLFLLFEWLSANFPNHYSIILGLLFIAIIYLLPNGVLEWAEAQWARRRREPANDMPAAEAPR